MHQNNKNMIIPLPLIMVKTQWWLSSVTTQINRIETTMNSDKYDDQVQRIADDHFLKIALRKLFEWLVEFDKYVEEIAPILDKLQLLYNIKLLRNISEHEVDYYKSNGNKQNKFINEEYNQSLIRPLIIDGIYYISGKINLNELKTILEELQCILSNNNYTIKFEAISVLNDLIKEPIV